MTITPISTTDDLRRCPFCFAEPALVVFEDETNPYLEPVYYVRCPDCAAEGPHRDTPDDAARWWNGDMMPMAIRDRFEDYGYV